MPRSPAVIRKFLSTDIAVRFRLLWRWCKISTTLALQTLEYLDGGAGLVEGVKMDAGRAHNQ